MSSDAMTGAADTATATMAPADLADASRRLLEQSFNTGNFELIDQLVAPEALNHDPALPAQMRDLRGPDALKRIVTMYRAAFPDLRMTVDDLIASGEKVVLRWHSEGTHRGELAGLAPSGVHGSVTGISIDRWQDGKIVEAWAEWDNMGLARQLGAAPPRAASARRSDWISSDSWLAGCAGRTRSRTSANSAPQPLVGGVHRPCHRQELRWLVGC